MRLLTIILLSFLFIRAAFAHENTSLKCRCLPNQDCWPSESDWGSLSKQLSKPLVKPKSELSPCKENEKSAACQLALKNMQNPFYVQSLPGETMSQGWYKAWDSQLSEYAVEAQSTKDVVAAVNFARQHNIKVVIKGAGHDYLGRNTGPDSLLIWTHPMRKITMHEKFKPLGCPNTVKSVQAVTVEAGTRWIDAYTEVTTKNKRYVQGGGCASVGAAGGFTQGGGFGSFSKKYGTSAGNVLQVEIVTADGKTLIANECQNDDLFWAVRGGGGSTFGVVTQMTLQTFNLPKNFGIYKGKITAKSDEDYQKLIKQFMSFYRDSLNNEHWGEQFAFNKDNTISIFMLFQGLSKEQTVQVWQPLQKWLNKSPNYTFENEIFTIPANRMWDYQFWKQSRPDLVVLDSRANAPKDQFWWAPNSGEASKYWYTYLSRWIPISLFEEDKVNQLADTVFKASRLAPITLHANKGMAGAANDALVRSKRSAINPVVYDAGALVIIAAGSNNVFPGVKGKEPNDVEIANIVKTYGNAYNLIKEITPNAGTYVNEADYFEKDWQTSFWGENYGKLDAIKKKYDPDGLFYCHHCVGSELWDQKGMCKVNA